MLPPLHPIAHFPPQMEKIGEADKTDNAHMRVKEANPDAPTAPNRSVEATVFNHVSVFDQPSRLTTAITQIRSLGGDAAISGFRGKKINLRPPPHSNPTTYQRRDVSQVAHPRAH